VEGLEAGADDYVVKPFDREELQARLRVGVRVLELQEKLTGRERENARLDLLAQASLALAHHLRNAVTPILGMADLFGMDASQETGEGLRKVAAKEGRRIAAIVDALLEMTRTGQVPTVPYAGQDSKQMLDMEPLIQHYLEARLKIL